MSKSTVDLFVDGIFTCSLTTDDRGVIIDDIGDIVDSDSIIDVRLVVDKLHIRTSTKHRKEDPK